MRFPKSVKQVKKAYVFMDIQVFEAQKGGYLKAPRGQFFTYTKTLVDASLAIVIAFLTQCIQSELACQKQLQLDLQIMTA